MPKPGCGVFRREPRTPILVRISVIRNHQPLGRQDSVSTVWRPVVNQRHGHWHRGWPLSSASPVAAEGDGDSGPASRSAAKRDHGPPPLGSTGVIALTWCAGLKLRSVAGQSGRPIRPSDLAHLACRAGVLSTTRPWPPALSGQRYPAAAAPGRVGVAKGSAASPMGWKLWCHGRIPQGRRGASAQSPNRR